MIWNSIMMMTIIDLAIIGMAISASWTFLRHRKALKRLNLSLGMIIILFGLYIIALFYFTDLLTMFIFPLFMPMVEAMEIMEDLHLNYNWSVTLIGVGLIVSGLIYMMRVLFPQLAILMANEERNKKKLERDIVRRNNTQAALETLATTDRLTKAYNRVKFEDIIEKEMERGKRSERPLSIFIFDIDNFKKINDKYGHLVGDSVLKSVASLARKHTRKMDYLVRWGGEEFIVVAPEADLSATKRLAERLQKAIEEYSFIEGVKATASFGVAQFRVDETEDDFINRADILLYRAKSTGKNRVEA